MRPAFVNRAVVFCLLANVLGGTTFVAMDRAYASGLPVVTFTFLRTALSTLLFVALCAWRRELAPKFSARDWGLVLLVAIPGFTLPLVLGVRGVALSTPGLGSILALMEPIAIVPLSFLFLGERPPRARIGGIALGLLGALLVVWSDALGGDALLAPGRRLGNVLLALQGAMWGVYTVAAKPLTGRHSALSISLWSTALGCAALGLVAPLEWATLRPAAFDALAHAIGLQDGVAGGAPLSSAFVKALPSMLFLGIFGSFVAVLFWNAGLKGVSPTVMAIFIFVQPLVGLLLNALLGKEAPTLPAWIGLVLILGAVLLVAREPPESSEPGEKDAASAAIP
jgi:drug/metabolite transporter (DMT)-like permease